MDDVITSSESNQKKEGKEGKQKILYSLYFHNKQKAYNYIIEVHKCFYTKNTISKYKEADNYFIHRVIDILEIYLYYSNLELTNDHEKDGKLLIYISITCMWIVQKFMDDFSIKLKDIVKVTKLDKHIILNVENHLLFDIFKFNLFQYIVK